MTKLVPALVVALLLLNWPAGTEQSPASPRTPPASNFAQLDPTVPVRPFSACLLSKNTVAALVAVLGSLEVGDQRIAIG
jgi:hypothetical protein